MYLEFKNKVDIKNPRKNPIFTEKDFFGWSSTNFYRTSYNDMGSKSPVSKKNCAIPGYRGYIPGVKADGHFGKTYTE